MMSTSSPAVLNAAHTAAVLPYAELVQQLIQAAHEKAQGFITTPTRQALDYPRGGTLLSMPATATDIGVHKLVNVMPHNASSEHAVIQGLVCSYDGHTGAPLFILDGPTVTERRTAAVSMMGLHLLWPNPSEITVIGAGVQARGHLEALLSLYPQAQINLLARNQNQAKALIQTLNYPHKVRLIDATPSSSDVVITVTSSSTPVYSESANKHRLLIAVGAYTADMAEIETDTVRSSQLFIDNPDAAQQEAGDYIQANVDWSLVQPIIKAHPELKGSAAFIYKTIGCAAWDLAAARCARLHL